MYSWRPRFLGLGVWNIGRTGVDRLGWTGMGNIQMELLLMSDFEVGLAACVLSRIL